MRIINAGSGREFEGWFETVSGDPTVPITAHWRLINRTANKLVQDYTAIPIEIESDATGITGVKAIAEVPGTLNVIDNARNKREVMEFQMVAALGTAHEYSEEPIQYYIRNVGLVSC